MTTVTIEMPEGVKKYVDRQVTQGEFSNLNEYILSLIARDAHLEELDRSLDEVDAEFQRGECSVHKKGDFIKMGEEIIRRHLEAKR